MNAHSSPNSPRRTPPHRPTILNRVPRKAWIISGTASGITALATGILVLLPASSSTPEPRARTYRNIDACLLTDSRGISTGTARATWQGMQDYSHATAVRVSYIPVTGPDTTANTEQFLASLIQRHCTTIISTGNTQNMAAIKASPQTPQTRFVIIGNTHQNNTTPNSPTNLTTLDPADPHLAETVTATLTHLITLKDPTPTSKPRT